MTLPPPPVSVLTIVTKRPLPSTFIRPRGEINGYPVALQWGTNTINIHPGVHHVKIYMPWLTPTGRAEITVDNRNDPFPTIYYAAPYVNLAS